MKVIVQDHDTKYYLADNGCWVATENDARDFGSVLPAYHFARNFTARGFTVLLYCPDDSYRAVIVEGKGTGGERMSQRSNRVSHWERFHSRMSSMRCDLN